MPVFELTEEIIFPPSYLAEEDGLLAVGGDLEPQRLLTAYALGIFPWYSEGDPILWWSPAPRLIMEPEGFIISRSLKKVLRKGTFDVTFDRVFPQVIEACSSVGDRRKKGTWITREMMDAYTRLHQLGAAHSVECWLEGELAGGLYGVSLGSAFFGESMFSRADNASKVALASLVELLKKWKFDLIDCQLASDHLIRLGAVEISREEFESRLAESLKNPSRIGDWGEGG